MNDDFPPPYGPGLLEVVVDDTVTLVLRDPRLTNMIDRETMLRRLRGAVGDGGEVTVVLLDAIVAKVRGTGGPPQWVPASERLGDHLDAALATLEGVKRRVCTEWELSQPVAA